MHDLDLTLSAKDSGFEGKADLGPPGCQLTSTFDWRLAPEKVGDEEARRVAQLTIDLNASGLPLSAALGEQATLQGLADLSASLHGSLAAPLGRAQLDQLAAQGLELGRPVIVVELLAEVRHRVDQAK